MKTILSLALLAAPLAINAAVVPMPPATAQDVRDGMATYKAITPAALSGAGISGAAAGWVSNNVVVATVANYYTNSTPHQIHGIANIGTTTAGGLLVNVTNSAGTRFALFWENVGTAGATTNQISFVVPPGGWWKFAGVTTTLADGSQTLAYYATNGSVAYATKAGNLAINSSLSGSVSAGDSYGIADAWGKNILTVFVKTGGAGGYIYYWGSITNQAHAFTLADTPFDGNQPRFVINYEKDLGNGNTDVNNQWAFLTNSVNYSQLEGTVISYLWKALPNSGDIVFSYGTNAASLRGSSAAIVSGTNSITASTNKLAVGGDLTFGADGQYAGTINFWDSLNGVYRTFRYDSDNETFSLDSGISAGSFNTVGSFNGSASGLTDATGAILASSTPASASAGGTAGQIRYDSSYLYICIGANTWRRVAIASW